MALNFLDFEIPNLSQIWAETGPSPSSSSADQWQWPPTYNLLFSQGEAEERGSPISA